MPTLPAVRPATTTVAVAALVAANLAPLLGVAFFGWRVADLMLLYWFENGVIGVYAVARMATVGRQRAAMLVSIPFFFVHYGIFWTGHGVFVLALFGAEGALRVPLSEGPGLPLPTSVPVPAEPGLALALVALIISHGVSFVSNWWLRGERRSSTPVAEMFRPYARVVVLHVVILLGGFATLAFGAPFLALVLLVALKLAVDLAAHRLEHAQRAAAADASAAGAKV